MVSIWVEDERPKKVSDLILPREMKKTFQSFVDNGNIPTLLLHGTGGVGKTSAAKAMCNELGSDYMMINGSDEGRSIDTLRTVIVPFASSISFTNNRKYVIVDEADYMSPNSVQPALRNIIEEFAKNCGFIFTANYPNKIIDPLKSRCSLIKFEIPKDERQSLAMEMLQRACSILEKYDVPYEKKAVAGVIQHHFPDFRRVLNELQRYSGTGKIDIGILSNTNESSLTEIVSLMKEKNFTSLRKKVAELDSDFDTFSSLLYQHASKYIKPQSLPALIMLIHEYRYKSAFVADHEINMIAFLVAVMMDIDFV